MQVFDNQTLPRAALPGIHHTTLACAGNGAHHLSIWRQTIDPGQATPPHRHDCEEVVIVASGHGRLLIGDEAFDFGPDSTLVLPAAIDHQIINDGTETMALMAVFPMTPVLTLGVDGNRMDLPWPT